MADPYRSHSILAIGRKSAKVADIAAVSIERRIGQRIQPQSNGCWLFKGNPERYGLAATVRRCGTSKELRHATHRYVYEVLVGPIDEGCHVHHTCETPGCCNPEHLIVLTPAEHRAEHVRLRRANRPPRTYQPDKRVAGRKRKALPVFEKDPRTGKYRQVK